MTKGKLLRDVYHLSDFYFGDSSGRYDIPQIKKVNFLPERLIDFSQALTAKDFGANYAACRNYSDSNNFLGR